MDVLKNAKIVKEKIFQNADKTYTYWVGVELNKDDARLSLVQQRALEIGAPLAYVNMTGGQDDLVFDGDTIVTSQTGQIIARAPQFEDGLMVIDLDVKLASSDPDLIISNPPILKYKKLQSGVARRLGDLEEIWQGLVVGLRDYVEKNNFKSVILGLSGGIDSGALVGLISENNASKVQSITITYSEFKETINDESTSVETKKIVDLISGEIADYTISESKNTLKTNNHLKGFNNLEEE